jgi:hypothetical protein
MMVAHRAKPRMAGALFISFELDPVRMTQMHLQKRCLTGSVLRCRATVQKMLASGSLFNENVSTKQNGRCRRSAALSRD